jgi:hypothetical protein
MGEEEAHFPKKTRMEEQRKKTERDINPRHSHVKHMENATEEPEASYLLLIFSSSLRNTPAK